MVQLSATQLCARACGWPVAASPAVHFTPPALSYPTPRQFLLPLALLFPVASALAGASLCLPHGSSNGGAHGKPGRGRTGASGSVLRLLVCVAPIYVWGAAITALPHKEERFLYVVYPLVRRSGAGLGK